MLVPWPPAGVTDVLTRALAPVAKSAPDGYTLVASDVPSHAISATFYTKLPYEVLNDFEPIAMIAGCLNSSSYKGTVPAITSVLQGDTVLAFGTIPGVVPHAKAGKLVLLGSSFGKRFSQIPEVPAVAETLPGFEMGFYTALFAPPRTPLKKSLSPRGGSQDRLDLFGMKFASRAGKET